MGKEKPQERTLPFVYNGLFGGTAGALGICFVQPMDLIKTRMQILGLQGQRPDMFKVASDVIQKEGIINLYTGLSCSIFRQYTYGLTRFTIFYNVMEYYKNKYHELPTLPIKMLMGFGAGGVGAVVGTPADVCLVRMTADGNLPPEKRRNYSHVFNALYRITKEEGLGALWRGVGATITRAMVITCAELTSYTQAREMIIPYLGNNIKTHFVASMVAGLCATVSSLPVDIIKTRVQNAKVPTSQLEAFRHILKNEGILALWSGFWPSYIKLGPHSVLTFVIFEQFIAWYFYYTA